MERVPGKERSRKVMAATSFVDGAHQKRCLKIPQGTRSIKGNSGQSRGIRVNKSNDGSTFPKLETPTPGAHRDRPLPLALPEKLEFLYIFVQKKNLPRPLFVNFSFIIIPICEWFPPTRLLDRVLLENTKIDPERFMNF